MGEHVRTGLNDHKAKRGKSPSKSINSHSRPHSSSRSIPPVDNGIAVLQKSLGNQAVGQLLRSGLIQAKLNIGAPDDIYEKEADRIADAVMRMPEPLIQPKPG